MTPISVLKRRRKFLSLIAATCAASSIATGRWPFASSQRADA
ncbi:twin-arginine translocation signal domain-containing protein [Paraburkholderia hospita]